MPDSPDPKSDDHRLKHNRPVDSCFAIGRVTGRIRKLPLREVTASKPTGICELTPIMFSVAYDLPPVFRPGSGHSEHEGVSVFVLFWCPRIQLRVSPLVVGEGVDLISNFPARLENYGPFLPVK